MIRDENWYDAVGKYERQEEQWNEEEKAEAAAMAVKLARQAGVEALRLSLRPAPCQMKNPPTTQEQAQALYDRCIAEYDPQTHRIKPHRPLVGTPLTARSGRLG